MEDPKTASNGIEMEIKTSSPLEEKPLPAPPNEETWSAAALPTPLTIVKPEPAPSPAPGPPRLKKKVPWKGKNIMVLLPWDDERGKKGKAPTPMTDRDVEAMLREWEQLGYDTTGFNLGHSSLEDREGGEGQSRSPWPHTHDMIVERKESSYKVSIPDKRGKLKYHICGFDDQGWFWDLLRSEQGYDLHSFCISWIAILSSDMITPPAS